MNKDEIEFLVKLRDGSAMIAEACNDYLNTVQPEFKKPQVKKPTAKDEYDMIPEGIRKYVRTVEDKGAYWSVKMKYVSAEKFQEISTAMKGINGKYVSAGKDTHWEVPK